MRQVGIVLLHASSRREHAGDRQPFRLPHDVACRKLMTSCFSVRVRFTAITIQRVVRGVSFTDNQHQNRFLF